VAGIGYEVPDEDPGAARPKTLPSPFGGERNPAPATLVVFGATGDLTHRKLIPALYDLACHGVLSDDFTIVGYGRQPLDDESFRAAMQQSIDDHYGEEVVDSRMCRRILGSPRYVQGAFDDPEGYERLAKVVSKLDAKTQGNRIFYLATPPSVFPVIIDRLGAAGLGRRETANAETGWTRIVIEKPFGHDLDSAAELNDCVRRAFDERQVYRIDHYLAKETVQNILVFRFANGIFEPIWNRRYIDFVQITAAETLGVEHRGAYYEEAGALRDMIQNHLLQLLTLTAMEPPVAFSADTVRDEKVKVMRAVRVIEEEKVDHYAVRGQYVAGVIDGEAVPGYREEERVDPQSGTETFAAVKFLVDNWRWEGVPFYVRTGKRLPRQVTEIAVQFRRPPFLLFRGDGIGSDHMAPNMLVMRIQPDEGISLRFQAKRPGQEAGLQPVDMDFRYGSTLNELPFSAYETLILDCMEGDPTLFNRDDQVEAAWRVCAPILNAWESRPPRGVPIYEAGSWGPEAADNLVARDGHRWRSL
jgi:glucose-6-phosphate 1-dehydrogenase